MLYKNRGQTLGAMLMKIKVISSKGNQISLISLFIRVGMIFTFIFSLFYVSLIVFRVISSPSVFFERFINPQTVILFIVLLNYILGATITLFWGPTKKKSETLWDIASSTYVVLKQCNQNNQNA